MTNDTTEEMVTVSRDLLNRVLDGRSSAFAELAVVLRNTPTRAEIDEDNRWLQMRNDAERDQLFGDDE